MKNKTEKIYSIYVLLGGILWFATILLRDLNLINDVYLKFLLGIIPNFAVVFLVFGIGMIYFPILIKKINIPLKKYYPYLLLILIWIFILITEYLHQVFINSTWDNFDIIASGLATLIIIIIHNTFYNKKN